MSGYQRQDTSNNIANNNVIEAVDLDNEFDSLEDAFNNTTGHTHDGSSTEGAPITVVGPSQNLTVSNTQVLPSSNNTLDLGSSLLRFKDGYFEGSLDVDGTINIESSATFQTDVTTGSLTSDSLTVGQSQTSDLPIIAYSSDVGCRISFNDVNTSNVSQVGVGALGNGLLFYSGSQAYASMNDVGLFNITTLNVTNTSTFNNSATFNDVITVNETVTANRLLVGQGETNDLPIVAFSTDPNCRIAFIDSTTSDNTQVGVGSFGNNLNLYAGGSVKVTVNSDGTVDTGAITAPSINLGNNDLDHYEQGSWTPEIADAASGGVAVAPSLANGIFTRVGNLVTLNFSVTGINTTGMTGTNNLHIRNLPFVSSSNAGNYGVGACYVGNVDFSGASNADVAVIIIPGTSYLSLARSVSGLAGDFLDVSRFTSGSSFVRASVSYMV